jgi:hypothetical protein
MEQKGFVRLSERERAVAFFAIARLLTIPKYYKYLSRETVTLTAMLLHTGDAVLNSPRFGCAACRRRFSL